MISYTSEVAVYHPWNYGHYHTHQVHRHCMHPCWCGVTYCCECSHQFSTSTIWTTYPATTTCSNSSGVPSTDHISASHSHSAHT